MIVNSITSAFDAVSHYIRLTYLARCCIAIFDLIAKYYLRSLEIIDLQHDGFATHASETYLLSLITLK